MQKLQFLPHPPEAPTGRQSSQFQTQPDKMSIDEYFLLVHVLYVRFRLIVHSVPQLQGLVHRKRHNEAKRILSIQ